MENNKTKTIGVIFCIIAIVGILASAITLSVYCNFANGVEFSRIEMYVNGEIYHSGIEVKNGVNQISIEADKGIDYYLCIDSDSGYISDNSRLIINDEVEKSTFIPVKVVLVKQNYAISEYVCYLMVA